jgi:ankyrin repeat protein
MKMTVTVFLAGMLMFFTGCGSQENAGKKDAGVQMPKVDLHSAVVTEDLDAIRQHIASGSDLNVLEPSRGSTPLITAAAMGKTEAAGLLIKAGADLNFQNADGSTALHTAAVFGNTQIAELLINAGADLNRQNNYGSTPLHTAAFFCRKEIVKALLDKGADKTIKNKMEQTALETIETPFDQVKIVYDQVASGLKPLGLKLDLERIRTTRPEIAAMLR